jgi:hypothetical protein
MKAFIFLSTDDLVEHLMELYRDINEDDEIYKKIYSQSIIEIKKYHTDYPYLQRTKKFGCWIV